MVECSLGKTRTLTDLCEKYALEYGPEKILICSLTRAAASVVARRARGIPKQNIGTLHAFAYRGLECPPIADTPKNLALWNEWVDQQGYAVYRISEGLARDLDDTATEALTGSTGGDQCFNAYNLARARLEDLDTLPQHVRGFVQLWEQFKGEHEMVDFNDLITLAHGLECAPGEPSVILTDECFPGHALVTLEDGSQAPIKDLVEGKSEARVASVNLKTGQIEFKRITGHIKVPLRGRELVQAAGLTATSDHPVWTQRGWMEWGEAVQRNEQILTLSHETLRQEREVNAEGAIHCSRVAAWGRIRAEESRPEGECASAVRAWGSAGAVSGLEVRGVAALGEDATNRPAEDGVWRGGLQLHYHVAPGLYGTSQSRKAGRGAETDYQESHPATGSAGLGSLVHGRRQFRSVNGDNCDLRLSGRGREDRRELAEVAQNVLQDGRNERRASNQASRKGSYEVPRIHRAAHSPEPGLQGGSGTNETEAGRACHPGRLPQRQEDFDLPALREGISAPEVGQELRVRGMRGHRQIGDAESLATEEEGRASGLLQGLRGMRLLLQGNAGQVSAHHCGAEDVRPGVPESAEGEGEEWVYCLNVEDNHNFFANGILTHNCQDFSYSAIRLLRHWADHPTVEHFVMVGDPLQALFQWAGGDPEAMLTPELPPEQVQILDQSYRVPAKPHAYALRLIDPHKRDIEQALGKEIAYHPRKEKGNGTIAEGSLRILPSATYKYPEPAIRDALERYLGEDQFCPIRKDPETGDPVQKDVMFIVACSHMLNPLIQSLRKHGILYHNPYRARGDWNPLSTRGQGSGMRLLNFLRLDERVWEHPRLWTAKELWSWVELCEVKGFLKRGAKEQIKAAADAGPKLDPDTGEELSGELTLADLDQWFVSLDTVMEVMELIVQGKAYDWLYNRLLGAKRKPMEYPISIARNQGPEYLRRKPRVLVGTIHSIKGGESSVAYVFPELSPSGMQNYMTPGPDRDAVLRAWYVALTRCIETTVLCANASPNSIQWPVVGELLDR